MPIILDLDLYKIISIYQFINLLPASLLLIYHEVIDNQEIKSCFRLRDYINTHAQLNACEGM